jgi:hypothetical protein
VCTVCCEASVVYLMDETIYSMVYAVIIVQHLSELEAILCSGLRAYNWLSFSLIHGRSVRLIYGHLCIRSTLLCPSRCRLPCIILFSVSLFVLDSCRYLLFVVIARYTLFVQLPYTSLATSASIRLCTEDVRDVVETFSPLAACSM